MIRICHIPKINPNRLFQGKRRNVFPYKPFSADSKPGGKFVEIKVDRSQLFKVVDDSKRNTGLESSSKKEDMTPLAKDLISYIKMRGPITLHDFITQAANNKVHGYYQHESDKIGTHGDFVTSPEISQIFGEMIAVWCVSVWEAIGSPPKLNIVELGPGNGTLMADILRTVSKFPSFKAAARVHLVELSETLQKKQAEKLGSHDHETPTEASPSKPVGSKYGVPLQWHKFVRTVPNGPALFIGQEFLDTFPVHQFRKVDDSRDGWREVLVDIDDSPESELHFRLVLSPCATPGSKTLLESNSPVATINAKKHDGSTGPMQALELCPLALATVAAITERLKQQGGAALFIDYGENHPQADTLRGFKSHHQMNPLSRPGEVDVTADVDFSSLARIVKVMGATPLGPVTQGEFLVQMGVIERVERLLALPSTTAPQAEQLVEAVHLLADNREGKNDMGIRFKVFGILSPKHATASTRIPGFLQQNGSEAAASSPSKDK